MKSEITTEIKHSDKGLETISKMGTRPENWGLTPIKWETKLVEVDAWILCKTCGGGGQIGTVDGKTVPGHVAWNSHKQETMRICESCPKVPFTKKGRSWYHEEAGSFSDRHHGAARELDYRYMNGLVRKCVMVERLVGTVLWAKGTKFDSRFGSGQSCALCAKSIPSGRFVPVNGKGDDDTVHGMWVGEDCARKFFGIKAFKPEQIVTREAR